MEGQVSIFHFKRLSGRGIARWQDRPLRIPGRSIPVPFFDGKLKEPNLNSENMAQEVLLSKMFTRLCFV
jgi:hypothetical protein